MKVFVWGEVEEATNSYHSRGGVVVFAETLERAKELAEKEGCFITMEEKPDEIRDTEGQEAVYIMPNAGCC